MDWKDVWDAAHICVHRVNQHAPTAKEEMTTSGLPALCSEIG